MLKTTVISNLAGMASLRNDWDALLERSSNNEPTMSHAWLAAWWEVFGSSEGRQLRIAAYHDGARLAGVVPLVRRLHRYRPGIPFRRLEAMASGEPEADEICSDYLGIIAERGSEDAIVEALADDLMADAFGPWDELSLPAMNGETVVPFLLARALRERGIDARTEVSGIAPYIPLPRSWDEYLAALPSSKRYLLRRSLRDFEQWAGSEWQTTRASTAADLELGTRILTSLHGERWAADGQSGVFASARFRAFHESVMPALLDRGSLDLRWLSVRGTPVAAAYSIVWRNKIHFYQSGRRLDVPRGVRPGIVMHAHAIRAAIESGMREYDFLAGSSRYKMDLSLAVRPIVRLRAARTSMAEVARVTTALAADQTRALRARLKRLFSPAPEVSEPANLHASRAGS